MKIFTPNHVLLYFGSGKHLIIHAAGKVKKAKLDIYRKKKHRMRAYGLPDLSVIDMGEIKKYAFSRLDRKYDWFGVIAFALPFLRQSDDKDFCVELVADAYESVGLDVIPESDPEECTPQQFERYVKSAGFKISYEWDKGIEEGELKNIAPGSIVFTESFSLFAKLIKWYQNTRTATAIRKLRHSAVTT